MPNLSFPTRLGIAARALVGLFSTGALEDVRGTLAGLFPSARGAPPRRGGAAVLQAYNELPWLRATANKISRSVASVRWQVLAVRPDGGRGRAVLRPDIQRAGRQRRRALLREAQADGSEVEVVEGHPLLEALTAGTGFHTGLAIRQLQQLYLDLAGEVFLLKERGPGGVPIRFWPLPPNWVTETPHPRHPAYVLTLPSWRGAVPDTEILWISDPNPADPYGRGSGSAVALGDELDTDEYAAKHAKQFFHNRARPDLIIGVDGMGEPERKRLEAIWLQRHQGFWNAFKPAFLNTSEFRVEQLGQSFKDLGVVELRRWERDTIIQFFGLPPEMLGVIESSNRATIEAADFLFSKWVLEPRLEFLREVIQERIVPEYDERIIVDYEAPAEEDKAHTLEVMRAAPWAWKVDEWREAGGSDPLDDGAGQVHMVPVALVARPELAPSTNGAAAGLLAIGARNRIAAELPDPDPLPRIAGPPAVVRQADDPPEYQIIHAIADSLAPAAKIAFLRAVERARDLVDIPKLVAALTSAGVEAAAAAFPWDALAAELSAVADEARNALIGSARGLEAFVSEQLGVSISLDLTNPRTVAWLDANAARLVTDISDATRDAIRQLVVRSNLEGIPPRELATRIASVEGFGLTSRDAHAVANLRADLAASGVAGDELERQVRAYAGRLLSERGETVARTELIAGANEGQRQLWLQAVDDGALDESAVRRVWIITPDDRTCPICLGVVASDANQDVRLEGVFTLPSGATVTGPPAHPRCRCAQRLRFVDA